MKGVKETVEGYVYKKTSEAARRNWERVVAKRGETPFNYRLDHIRRVVDFVKTIGPSEGADPDVVRLSAWLHDVSKPGLNSRGDHGKASAHIASEVLSKHGVPSDKIRRVEDTIIKHVGLTLEEPLDTPEARTLWDADKLAKIGSVGISHHILNSILLDPGRSSEDFCSSFEEFLPLAEKIAESMNTDMGRELASRKLEVLRAFTHELRQELGRTEESENV